MNVIITLASVLVVPTNQRGNSQVINLERFSWKSYLVDSIFI